MTPLDDDTGSKTGLAPAGQSPVADSGPDPTGNAEFDELVASLPSISLLDFRQPARLASPVEEEVRAIHERFARRISTTMALFLGKEVWARVVSVDSRRMVGYRESVGESVSFAEIELQPSGTVAVVDWGAPLAFAMVECLLGGPGSFEHAPRPLTSIESRIFRRLAEKFGHELTRSLHGSGGNHAVRAVTSDLNLVAKGDPTDLMVQVTMELGFEGGSAPFSLVYRLHDWKQPDKESPPPDPQVRESMTRALERADVELQVELGRARLTVDDVRTVRLGDVIRLDQRVDQEVIVRIDQVARFAGMPGKLGTRRAVRVTRIIEEES